MPSQLSTSTSTASSGGYNVRVNGTVERTRSENPLPTGNARQATSLVGNTVCSRKAESMGASVKDIGNWASTFKSLCNGEDSSLLLPKKGTGHNGHHTLADMSNGMPPMEPNFSSPKTEGAYSNELSSLTAHSDEGRLVQPQEVLLQAADLVVSKTNELTQRQRTLQDRYKALLWELQEKQLAMASRHIWSQLAEGEGQNAGTRSTGRALREVLTDSSSSMSNSFFPIQVDGASDSPPVNHMSLETPEDIDHLEGVVTGGVAPPTRSRYDDSFSSLESYASSSLTETHIEAEGLLSGRTRRVLRAQGSSMADLVDPDCTDSSSDEEETDVVAMEGDCRTMRSHLRHSWGRGRIDLGSRWLWLQRKIAELNKFIYTLDHHLKGASAQDQCVFGPAPSTSLPQYLSLSNGSSTLEKLRAVGTAIGVGGTHPLLPFAKAAALTGKHGGANGFSPASATSLSYLPHLLLPEAILGGGNRLHVKDLLSPAPLGQNLLSMDENASARTRPLVKRSGFRKIVRLDRHAGKMRGLDPVYHSHLSLPHELPSRMLLDSVMRDILADSSYSQLPLSKRRRAAINLPHLSTPPGGTMELHHSPSPSPVHTPYSSHSSRSQSRKKSYGLQQQTSLDSLSTASTLGGSPWSPGVSHPPTPSLTPGLTPQGSSARKKKTSHSTPLFDINNIVIPYSMASSTRLEKLEYKEIITPRWRALEADEGGGEIKDKSPTGSAEPMEEDSEDLSDETISKRHGRCELNEKKRFLNFISGSNHRRKTRPQSMTLSESPEAGGEASLMSPPQRRVTVTSPIPSELEIARLPEVAPWQPRSFPLNGEDEDALSNPPPPPAPTLPPSSPFRSLHASTSSHSPSCNTSAYTTPLPSPLSTPVDETPANSPAEWVVNSQFSTAPTPTGHSLQQPPRFLSSSPLPQQHQHQPIILKLTKKT